MAKSKGSPKGGRSLALSRRWKGIKDHARDINASFRERYELRRVDHDIADESDLIDVEEELQFEFESTYSQQTIKLAARSLRKYEWVMLGHPRHGHPAPPSSAENPKPRLGRARELQARAELGAQLHRLRSALREYTEAMGPIGSNNTRGTLELDADIPPSAKTLQLAIDALERQLASPRPVRAELSDARRRIRAWRGTWRWFREKADRAVNSVVDQVGPILKWAIISAALIQSGDRLAEEAHRSHAAAERWERSVFDEAKDPQPGDALEGPQNRVFSGAQRSGIPPPAPPKAKRRR